MLAPMMAMARSIPHTEPAANFDALLSFAESLAATVSDATSRHESVQVAAFVTKERKQEAPLSFGDLLDQSFHLGT
jgi:hypothetical protein